MTKTVATVFTAIMAMAVVVFLWCFEDPYQPTTRISGYVQRPDEPTEIVGNSRNVTPETMLPGPKLHADDALVRLPGRVISNPTETQIQVKKFKITGIPNAGTLISGNNTLVLKGIIPTPLDRQCIDSNGQSWPCGRFARTALRNFIRGRTLTCEQATPGELSAAQVYHCTLDGKDVSNWLAKLGWAQGKDSPNKALSQTARQNQRGLWALHRP